MRGPGSRAGFRVCILFTTLTIVAACTGESLQTETASTTPTETVDAAGLPRNVYFGDTHIHTALSLDAYLVGTRSTPDDAYEFAQGKAITHPSGFTMQLSVPLDFIAVSDHADFLGMMRALNDGQFPDHPLTLPVRGATNPAGSDTAFSHLFEYLRLPMGEGRSWLDNRTVGRSAWQEIIAAAERHYRPGQFTTFIGYEYTSAGTGGENLHRNVIFRDHRVPELPFSNLDSRNPEDLWNWMDEQRAAGMDSLAIPHNSNGSDGQMFDTKKWDGAPLDGPWATQRMRNEPIVENTQVKGTSDTHPLLSPNDEWADFEIMPLRIAIANQQPSRPQGSYVREAWLNGLALSRKLGTNPYQFGVIGSSDSHNAAGSFDEADYWSKLGVTDSTPQQRGSVPYDGIGTATPTYANHWSKYWGASGLAAVWAPTNTREAIFQAMRRGETFSTTGPRIKLRFFAGQGLTPDLLDEPAGLTQAYALGVPMGGKLTPSVSPTFLIWAVRDPEGEPLQRLQIIKGWLDKGTHQEQIFDVACSDNLEANPNTHRCPDNGARVDLDTCSTSTERGDTELRASWQDPTYDPNTPSFYYVRVLENPSCRWSTYDAIQSGVDPRPDLPATIQERAWSSPIWITP